MLKKRIKLASLSVLFFCFLFNFSFGYEPTSQDDLFLDKIKIVLSQNINIDGNPKLAMVERYHIFNQTQKLQTPGTKADYLIAQTKKFLREKIDEQKKPDEQKRKQNEQKFLEQFQSKIITNQEKLPDRCFSYYEIIDDFSWANDVPPSLTIASRQIETTCNFKNYKHGLFQIMFKDYGNTQMTQKEFIKQLQDFFNFAKHKRNWYDTKNKKNGLSVGLSYTDINLKGIVRHGALYNGLSGHTVYGDIQPLSKNYVFGNFGNENKYKKDGLLVDTLKSIQY